MKKGISPLIATVLVIGVTIAVFTFVFTWQSGFIQNIIQGPALKSAECSKVNFEISNACYIGDTIVINFENIADSELEGIEFRIRGEDTVQFAPSPPFKTYKVGENENIVIPYLSYVGALDEIEVIPKVKISNNAYLCTEEMEVIINIPEC